MYCCFDRLDNILIPNYYKYIQAISKPIAYAIQDPKLLNKNT